MTNAEHLAEIENWLALGAKHFSDADVRTLLALLKERDVDSGAALISAERKRQQDVEGWTPEDTR